MEINKTDYLYKMCAESDYIKRKINRGAINESIKKTKFRT